MSTGGPQRELTPEQRERYRAAGIAAAGSIGGAYMDRELLRAALSEQAEESIERLKDDMEDWKQIKKAFDAHREREQKRAAGLLPRGSFAEEMRSLGLGRKKRRKP